MGHIRTKCRLRGTKRRLTLKNILVDAGATYTTLPPQIAEQIGVVKTPWKIKVELADGRAVQARVGMVELEMEGRKATVIAVVLKAPEALIGVQALEALGFKVNPVKQRLEPTRPSKYPILYCL